MFQIIPPTFRATITDRFIAAFFKGKADAMLQAELQFSDSSIDAVLLEKAMDLALDAEPVLGCRFVNEKTGTRWKRIDNADRKNFRILSSENEYEAYRMESIDATVGPALQGGLFSTGQGDRIIFKIAHEVSDAAGARDAAALVAMLYRQLKRSPDYKPAPNIKSYRSARQILKWLPKRVLPFIWLNAAVEILSLLIRRRACNPWSGAFEVSHREYVTRTIAAEQCSALKAYASQQGATFNDLLVSAFMRAVYTHKATHGWLRCAITVDLRRWYLPGGRADTIANLSGFEMMNIGRKPGTDFLTTLRKVRRFTAGRKNRWIGLNMTCGMMNVFRAWSYSKLETFFRKQQERDIKEKAVFPVFTNMGSFDKDAYVFEGAPQNIHLLVPAALPPYLGVGVSNYQGMLTISTVSYSQTADKINALLDTMVHELLTITNN